MSHKAETAVASAAVTSRPDQEWSSKLTQVRVDEDLSSLPNETVCRTAHTMAAGFLQSECAGLEET